MEAILQQNIPDTTRLRLLRELSAPYASADPKKRFYYANAFRELAERLHNMPALAEADINTGIAQAISGKLDSSLYYFTQAYNVSQKNKYVLGMGKSLADIGLAHDRLDDKRGAVNYYLQAIEIFKKIGFTKGIDQCNMNIGSLYYDLAQYEIAESYAKQCLKSYTAGKDQRGLGNALYSMGNCAQALGRDKEALGYFNQSLAIRQKIGDVNGIALSQRGLGMVYLHFKQYDKALSNLDTALRYTQKLQDRYEEAAIRNTMANVYLAMKNYNKAVDCAQQELTAGRSVRSKDAITKALGNLVAIYKSKNEVDKAFKYQSLFVLTEDSLLVDKSLKDITLAEFGRIRNENETLSNDNKVITSKNTDYLARINHYSNVIVITSITLVFVILLTLLLYRRNLEKQESNKMLLQQQVKIALINKELTAQVELTREQNAELGRLNDIKNKFFSIVSHDLRGPLTTLHSLFGVYREGHVGEDELRTLLPQLEETILTTSAFLDNLLEWAKSQLEGIVIKAVDFNINECITDNIHLLETKIAQKNLKVSLTADNDVTVHADRNMINLVIRNLLSNSVKFCRPGDEIIFRTLISDGKAKVSIHDTGPGISEADREKLFSLEHIISTGAQGEKGNHLGLILCRDMVAQNQGNIWLEPNSGDGTTFWIELLLSS